MFKNYTLRLPSVFRYLLLLSITILISLSRSIPLTYADPSADLTVQIQDDVQLAGVTRFGINLGAQDQYGAAQLLKNLVINPGFEAGEHQMLFNVAANPEAWHVQADNWDTAWNNPVYQIGQAEGYWKRGSYLVLSGPTRGRTGPIGNFTYENNLYALCEIRKPCRQCM